MLRLTRAEVQPIGLDIGQDSIKMLQLEVVGGGALAVRAACKQAMPDEAREQPQLRSALAVDVIRRMMRQAPFVGKRVIACLPREVVHVKNLRLPPMPAPDLAAAAKFEARNLFPFDTDQAQVRVIHAGEVRQGAEVRQEVIVLAVPDEEINNLLEQLHRSGAVIEALDVEFLALFRSVEKFIRRREDEQEVQVVVDIGLRRSQVVIGKGREISFCKPIDIGGGQLNASVARKLGISVPEAAALRRRLAAQTEPVGETSVSDRSDASATARRDPVRQAVFDATRSTIEDLGREIALCLRYYSVTFRGQRPARLRLVGGEASDPQVLAMLNAAIAVPTEAGRPLFSVDTSRMKPADRQGAMSEWAVALGLGLKLTSGHFGARDGRARTSSRDEGAAPDDAPAAAGIGAEVVDINKAVAEPRAAAVAVAGGAHA